MMASSASASVSVSSALLATHSGARAAGLTAPAGAVAAGSAAAQLLPLDSGVADGLPEYPTDKSDGHVDGHGGSGGGGEDQDQDEDEDEDDDEEDDEEKEPLLKYQRVGARLPATLAKDAARCLTAHDKYLVLGTQSGCLYQLDLNGNEVLRVQSHSSQVNAVSTDLSGDFVGSCSDDGSVVVTNLYSKEQTRVSHGRPVRGVALSPQYKTTQALAAGGRAGQLVISTKGWFGPKDTVVHAGEGPIQAVAWAGDLVAWANDAGVKVLDHSIPERVSFVAKPKPPPFSVSAPAPVGGDPYDCHLVWAQEDVLLIGWGCAVKVGQVRQRRPVARGEKVPGNRYMQIIALFQTDYIVCGIAPFKNNLVLLAYTEEEDDDDEEDDDADAAARPRLAAGGRRPAMPDLRVVTYTNVPVSSDALTIAGYRSHGPRDYSLAYLPGTDEPLFYVVSPRDIVLARPRDLDDHIGWLMGRGRYREALDTAALGENQLQSHSVAAVGTRLLEHLLQVRDFAACAALCPRVLGTDANAWSDWVSRFAAFGQARALAPYVPQPLTAAEEAAALLHAQRAALAAADGELSSAAVAAPAMLPRAVLLPASTCTALLLGLLDEADLPLLLTTLRAWAPSAYSVPTLTDAVIEKLRLEGYGPAAAPGGPTAAAPVTGAAMAGSGAAATAAASAPGSGDPSGSGSATPLDRAWVSFSGMVARARPHNAEHAAAAAADAVPAGGAGAGESDSLESLVSSLPPVPVRARVLLEILGELFIVARRYTDALSVYLDAGREDVFDLIAKLELFDVVRRRVLTLTLFDPRRAIALFVQHHRAVAPDDVVAQLQRHPRLLHEYLHALFRHDPALGVRYHRKQVRLYARYAPAKLLFFLRNSNSYLLEEALQVCEEHAIHDATVFLLRRMGNTARALAITVDDLRDVDAALALVDDQKDEALWGELIDRAVSNPPVLSELLSRVGAHDVDVRRLVRAIPDGLAVPHLKASVLHVLRETRSQIAVNRGCCQLLRLDLATSNVRLHRRNAGGTRIGAAARCQLCGGPIVGHAAAGSGSGSGAGSGAAAAGGPRRGAAGTGKPASSEAGAPGVGSGSGDVTVFGCGHAFHSQCLTMRGLGGDGARARCPIDAPQGRPTATSATATAAVGAGAVSSAGSGSGGRGRGATAAAGW
jgi:hypothetical protein